MSEWSPKLKYYPHFDKIIEKQDIIDLVTNTERVKKNSFFPFLVFSEQPRKFGGKRKERDNQKPRPIKKPRVIRFASRRDSYIFSYYRYLLSIQYEEILKQLGLTENVIAYRTVPVQPGSDAGKSSIHFARDAFLEIRERGNCIAMALDISDFFGSMAHTNLRRRWMDTMGFSEMCEDHEAVFRAITQWADVDYIKALERFGFRGKVMIDGVEKIGLTLEQGKKVPIQLCKDMDEFRHKICGEDGSSSLIDKEVHHKGIPQGAPISDILANIYLTPFDTEMKKIADDAGAYYRRYSDDILLICPSDASALVQIYGQMSEALVRAGGLNFNNKTMVKTFSLEGVVQRCRFFDHSGFPDQAQSPMRNKPFEYLGFSFDGQFVRIKDSTLSGYYRKMKSIIQSASRQAVGRYPGKDLSYIKREVRKSQLHQKFGQIEAFEMLERGDYKKWNFMTYVLNAARVMRVMDNQIIEQLRNHRKKVNELLENELQDAFKKRSSTRRKADMKVIKIEAAQP